LTPTGPDTLTPGAAQQLTTTVYAANNRVLSGQTIIYASSNSYIAAVNSTGLVTATGQIGKAIITVTVISDTVISDSAEIVVYDPSRANIPQTITLAQPISSVAIGSSTPVSVKVTDVYNHPVTGTTVTFSVQNGGGTVTPASAVTDVNGIATTVWTIGTSISSNTIDVQAGSAEGVFNCTPLPGPPARIAMSAPFAGLTPGNYLSLSAYVHDAYGNQDFNAKVQFVARDPSLFLPISDPPPGSTTLWTQAIGQTYVVGSIGNLSDSTLVAVFPNDGVLVSVPAPRFDLKTDTTFTTNVQVSTGPSTPGIGSLTATITWDPTVLHYEADSPSGQPVGSVTVNRDNTANGSLTIAIASGTSIGAPASLRVLTFHAASSANLHGTLSVAVSEISTTNFTSLLPVTQVVSFPVRTR